MTVKQLKEKLSQFNDDDNVIIKNKSNEYCQLNDVIKYTVDDNIINDCVCIIM